MICVGFSTVDDITQALTSLYVMRAAAVRFMLPEHCVEVEPAPVRDEERAHVGLRLRAQRLSDRLEVLAWTVQLRVVYLTS